MGKQTLVKRTFAEKFAAALAEKQVGKRTLARQLSASREGRQSVDTMRRLLNKYLRTGVVPTEVSRHEIEAALGLDRDTLKPDADDDEEADPAVKLRRIRAELVLLGREDLADDLKKLAAVRGGVS
jgi:hypothetical protein